MFRKLDKKLATVKIGNFLFKKRPFKNREHPKSVLHLRFKNHEVLQIHPGAIVETRISMASKTQRDFNKRLFLTESINKPGTAQGGAPRSKHTSVPGDVVLV